MPALLTAMSRRPNCCHDLRDHGLDLGFLGDVARDEQTADAHRADLVSRLLSGRLVEIDNRHVGSGSGQRDGTTSSDAHRTAGHQSLSCP